MKSKGCGVNMVPKLEELYKQGTEAFEKGDYIAAERFFYDILRQNPRFADIQNKIGIIYNQTNRLSLATEAFEKALAVNPAYTEAALNLAITYSDLGKYEKAREVLSGRLTSWKRRGNPQAQYRVSTPLLGANCQTSTYGLATCTMSSCYSMKQSMNIIRLFAYRRAFRI